MNIRKTVRTKELIVEKTETLKISRRTTRPIPDSDSEESEGDRPASVGTECNPPAPDRDESSDAAASFIP